MYEELLNFIYSLIIIVTAMLSFLIALWKLVAQLNESIKNQNVHNQSVLSQIINLFGSGFANKT